MDRIYGAVGRPTVGAAVPCGPHGVNRVENVEYVERGNWPWRTWREGESMGSLTGINRVEYVERGPIGRPVENVENGFRRDEQDLGWPWGVVGASRSSQTIRL